MLFELVIAQETALLQKYAVHLTLSNKIDQSLSSFSFRFCPVIKYLKTKLFKRIWAAKINSWKSHFYSFLGAYKNGSTL